MEDQNPNTQNIPPTITAPVNPTTSSTFTQSKINLLLILLTVLVSAGVFGLGGYYFGRQSVKPQQNFTSTQNQSTPTAIPQTSNASPSPMNQQAVTLPSGWSYKTNNECGVKFAIPPKSVPYLGSDGRFWDFPRGASYPNLLSKLLLPNQDYKQAITMYATKDETSGFVSQSVVVSCIPNSNRFTNNNELLSTLTSKLREYNSSTGEKGMQASTYTIKASTPTSRWNNQVIDLAISEYFENSGGQPYTNSVEYTMFVTPQYLYEVRAFGATTDNFVKQTAEQIFDNLSF